MVEIQRMHQFHPMLGFFRIASRQTDLECDRIYCQFQMAVDRAAAYTPSRVFSLSTKLADLQRIFPLASRVPFVKCAHLSRKWSSLVWIPSLPYSSDPHPSP